MAPSQTQAAGGAEILSGEGTPESRAGAEPEVSVWSLAKGGSGRVGFAGGGPSSSEGFASLGPAPPGAVLEGRAEQGSGRPSRPVAAGSRHTQGESPAAFLISVWLP